MITLEAFDSFKANEANFELVQENKFGVLVMKDNDWVATEITEDDFVKYTTVDTSKFIEGSEEYNVFEKANDLSAFQYKAWPLVVEIIAE